MSKVLPGRHSPRVPTILSSRQEGHTCLEKLFELSTWNVSFMQINIFCVYMLGPPFVKGKNGNKEYFYVGAPFLSSWEYFWFSRAHAP